jgi:hypothetical protein
VPPWVYKCLVGMDKDRWNYKKQAEGYEALTQHRDRLQHQVRKSPTPCLGHDIRPVHVTRWVCVAAFAEHASFDSAGAARYHMQSTMLESSLQEAQQVCCLLAAPSSVLSAIGLTHCVVSVLYQGRPLGLFQRGFGRWARKLTASPACMLWVSQHAQTLHLEDLKKAAALEVRCCSCV